MAEDNRILHSRLIRSTSHISYWAMCQLGHVISLLYIWHNKLISLSRPWHFGQTWRQLATARERQFGVYNTRFFFQENQLDCRCAQRYFWFFLYVRAGKIITLSIIEWTTRRRLYVIIKTTFLLPLHILS